MRHAACSRHDALAEDRTCSTISASLMEDVRISPIPVRRLGSVADGTIGAHFARGVREIGTPEIGFVCDLDLEKRFACS